MAWRHSSLKFRFACFPSQVNLHALQCLPKILPCLANQSGALVPPLVSALTSNLASKNSNIFSTAVGALDALIKNIGNSVFALISRLKLPALISIITDAGRHKSYFWVRVNSFEWMLSCRAALTLVLCIVLYTLNFRLWLELKHLTIEASQHLTFKSNVQFYVFLCTSFTNKSYARSCSSINSCYVCFDWRCSRL